MAKSASTETVVHPAGLLAGTRLGRLPRNVVALGVVSFLTDVSSEMTLTVLPLFLANVLRTPTGIIGLIEGIAEATASLMRIGSGWTSDRLGSRKGLTLAGYSISGLTKPLLVLAATWPAVLVLRFADRVGKGVRTAPRDALIADSVAPERRGLAFGFHRAADTAGAVLGLALAAGISALMLGNGQALTRGTYQTIVLVASVPGLLSVVVLWRFVQERRQPRPAAEHRAAAGWSMQGIDRHFGTFLGIVMVFTLGNSSDAFLMLRAQNLGSSVVQVLAMVLLFNVLYAALATPLGILSDRLGRLRVVSGGWLAYAGIYVGFAVTDAAWHVWVLYALYGVYYAATEGVSRALVADIVPQDRRGTAYGLYSGAVGLMAFPASVLAGILWQGVGPWSGWGPRAPFVAGAVLALAAAALLLLWGVARQERDNTVAG